jgi:hypothetical protein
MFVLRDLIAQLTSLLRKEAQLARVELSENVSRAAIGLGLIVGGAVLLIPALVILLEAAVAALEQNEMGPAQAAGIVGGCALALGFISLPSAYPAPRQKSDAQQNHSTAAI